MSKLPTLAAALCTAAALALPAVALAKLPAPSPEAKAKADEAKAKGAHGDKVGAYKLCLAMDRTAAHYLKTSGKDPKAVTATTACADPGPFVYNPDAAAAPAAAPAAPAAAPVAAAPAAAPAKK
jgi:hypothetical protein